MINNLSIAAQDFFMRMLTSIFVDNILLHVMWSTNFKLATKGGDESFLFNINKLFYLCSSRAQLLLQLAPGYVAEIQLG